LQHTIQCVQVTVHRVYAAVLFLLNAFLLAPWRVLSVQLRVYSVQLTVYSVLLTLLRRIKWLSGASYRPFRARSKLIPAKAPRLQTPSPCLTLKFYLWITQAHARDGIRPHPHQLEERDRFLRQSSQEN